MKSNTCLVLAVGVLMALSSGATETVVGRYGHADFTSASTVAADDVWFVSSQAGWVTKSGAGAWTLPLSNFLGFFGGGFELGLRGGTLDLASGTSPDYVTTPPAALQKAAVWLSADKNVATDGSTGCVLGWYDAREASAAAGSHCYAAAAAAVPTETGVVPTTFQGKVALSFGTYNSSQPAKALYLKNSEGGDYSCEMCEAIYVFSFSTKKKFAPVLGNGTKAYFFTNPGVDEGCVLSSQGNANWKTYQCEFRHNGDEADPTVGLSAGTLHVCGFTAPRGFSVPVDSLVNDRGNTGGCYLHEIVLFSSRLTDLQRAEVTAYLVQKWGVQTSPRIDIDVADGACVQSADASLFDLVRLSGHVTMGTVSDPNARLQMILDYGRREMNPRYRLSTAGEELEVQGTEYALQLADGDAVSVDDSNGVVRSVRNSPGVQGKVSVAGSGRSLVVDRMPSASVEVTAQSGEIVLRAPTDTEPKYVPGDVQTAVLGATALSIPAGLGGASTTVTFPADGDWEVEFNLSNDCTFKTSGGKWTDGKVTAYRLSLLDQSAAEVFSAIAQTVKPSEVGGTVQHRRYLIRNVVAGTYTFAVKGADPTSLSAALENLAFDFVPHAQRETVVPVVGGDFEQELLVKPFFPSVDNNNSSDNWQLTNGGLTQNPVVQGVANSMMGFAVTTEGYDFQFRSHELGRYGDNALLWIHTNSTSNARNTAMAKKATTLSAGTWRLRMKGCRMTTGTDEFSQVAKDPNSNLKRCGKYPAVFAAAVKVNGGAEIDLGRTDEVDAFSEKTYWYPNAFTVEDNASVVLSLDQLVGWAFALVDDFEFVRVDDDTDGAETLDEELIVNGSFETKGDEDVDMFGWTREDYEDTSGKSPVKRAVRRWAPIQNLFGTTGCEGNYVARSFNGGRISQVLALEAGTYRLSYWSRPRFKSENGMMSGLCKLHFWYAPVGGSSQTNVICDSDTLWSTNFTQHTVLFEVKEAGNYDFGFNSDHADFSDSLIDCVSIRRVLGTPRAPATDEGTGLTVTSADPASKVRLDYRGTMSVKSLRVFGRKLYGEVSAANCPECFVGPGKINVTGAKPGLILDVR